MWRGGGKVQRTLPFPVPCVPRLMALHPGTDHRPGASSRSWAPAQPEAPARARGGRPRQGMWVAAGSLLGIGVAAVVWTKERAHLAQREQVRTTPVQVTLAAGSRPQTFPLPDGSRVTLAPGSTLRSRGVFDDTHRALALSGEALFNVAEADAPFVVEAAGVTIEDLSTAFVVRAIPAVSGAPARALVAVTQGEVRVRTAGWQGAVQEGAAVLVDSTGAHTALAHDEALGSVAWTSGALLFADESLLTVVERLERWTGFAIEVDPALSAHRLSIAIEAESPVATLTQVAAAVDGRAVERGGRWLIAPR